MQQIAINTLPFWSRFALDADLRYDGVNLYRRVLSSGSKVRAFDYRQGENNVNALQGQGATERDTILTKANETRGGGKVLIRGISITRDGEAYEVVEPNDANRPNASRNQTTWSLYPGTSHPAGNGDFGPQTPSAEDVRGLGVLFNMLFSQFQRVNMNVDGTRRILEMGPGILHPGINGATGDVYAANGSPYVTNFWYIPEGIEWNPAGAVDSNLTVDIMSAYDLDLPTYTTPFGTADGQPPSADNPPIDGAEPTPLGRLWRQAWIVNFHGAEESPTSDIS